MVSSMMVAEHVCVRMMKKYFEIEASKETPQYGFRKGLKLFSDKGYQATKDELNVNLLGRGCICMLSSNNLSWDTRKQALGYLMFFKRKRSRKMNARGYANVLNKNKLQMKNQVHQLFSLYALMGSCLMDAKDERKLITLNMCGSFLQGNWQQDKHHVYIMFKGIMVNMICEIDPSYNDKIIWSKTVK